MRNEKAKRFLLNMARKPGVSFETFFPKADAAALALLKRMLAFDPSERPSAVEALQARAGGLSRRLCELATLRALCARLCLRRCSSLRQRAACGRQRCL